MRALGVAVLLFAIALAIRVNTGVSEGRAVLWNGDVVALAALGRSEAAADVVWMRTLQLIGSTPFTEAGYPELEKWLMTTSELDPTFSLPYTLGGILLTTDAKRAGVLDAYLARGEEAMPNDFQLPMMRGFVAYFGALDSARAAGHYERAARLPNAPPYLTPFAKRLREEVESCAGLRRRLQELVTSARGLEREQLKGQYYAISEHCDARAIGRAAATFRLTHNREPSYAELLASGLLTETPVAEPGRCWTVDPFGNPSLTDCAGVAP